MIELWELQGRNDCRYSTFAWRTRLALHHKGLDFKIHPVAVSDKQAIAFSGQDKVPILRNGDRVVCDSWAIAVYLEAQFPAAPSLFGGPVGANLSQVFNGWVDRELLPQIVPYLMRDVLDCVEPVDATHLRTRMEGALKRPLEELSAERERNIVQLRRRLQPVRKVLEQTPFLGGDQPTYADYSLFGLFQWARVVSLTPLLEPGDALAAWLERTLDLYDGVGRREKTRAERMPELEA
jgi:glutathione S-transferase